MAKIRKFFTMALTVALMSSCGTHSSVSDADSSPNLGEQLLGHYTYEHAFNYDYLGNHFDVSETGTMDFYADGTGLDSAQQVYTVTRPDGDTIIYVFDYVSPSRWSLDADTFFFAGIKESFRMEPDKEDALSQEIVKLVSGSIDYQYKFHLDSLTAEKMQWSFIYRDGQSDTWVFERE